jgi:hypothetical protein
LRDKKILVVKTFAVDEVEENTLQITDKEIKDFFNAQNYSALYQSDFSAKEEENFSKTNRAFFEDFTFSFRVNKDLIKSLSQTQKEDLLFVPQIIFWVCDLCEEENFLSIRMSLIDIKIGELVWFADNYYRFSVAPTETEVKERLAFLWKQVFSKIKKDFKE